MANAASIPQQPALARWVVPAAALVGAGSVVAALDGAGPSLTTYAAASVPAHVADLVAGLAMISVGAVLWLVRPGPPGVLAVLIGCTWSANDWVGRQAAPPMARSVAMLATPFLLALVVHLALKWPSGRATWPHARTGVLLAYGVATVVAVGQALVRDPLFDQNCWRNCTDNAFLVRADVDVAQALEAFRLWSSVVVGGLLVAAVAWWLARASPAARTATVPVLVPAALVAVAEVGYAVVLLQVPEENPSVAPFTVVFLVRAAALTALALGLARTASRTTRTRRAVGRLAQDLASAPAPGLLRDVLARSVGDDRLEVAYWLDGPQRYVDAEGRTVDPVPTRDQAVTTITRDDRRVAIVVHDRSLREAHDLKSEIGAATRLAVDNERLRAEVLFRLEDLRASQARVVARSDATRRGLERDLHDGAQQRLLAVSSELRLALAAAGSHGDAEVASLLTRAATEAALALTELRELAHGIFPAILADAGLGPALRTYAAAAPLALDVAHVVDRRWDLGAESAAYVVVVEAVADAVRRSASYVSVAVEEDAGHVVVALHDDGSERDPAQLVHLVDRVGALGGRMHAGTAALRAEIPCG